LRARSPAIEPTVTCVNPLLVSPAAERILVIRLGAVGDVVRTLPAVSALRRAYPDAEITWLVEAASQSALCDQPWIDRVLVFPRPELSAALRAARLPHTWRIATRFARELRRGRFDLVLDFHAIAKSAILAQVSGASLRISYARPFAREGAHWLTRHRAELSCERVSRFARNLALVRYLGTDAVPEPNPFRVGEPNRRWAREQLGEGLPAVIVHPGTSAATPHKRWAREGYATVSRSLASRGYIPWITYGPDPGERAAAADVAVRSGATARLAPPTPTLAKLAALLACARLYIGADTGPLHVASLVGTPVVQILGPTDPVENAPYPETPARCVRVPVACSPCRRGCAARVCMRVVSPAAVLGAAWELLAAREAG